MALAGWLTIGVKSDTSKFDKEMARLEKQIQKKEQRKIEIEADLKSYDEEIKKLDELAEKKKQVEKELKIAEFKQSPSERINSGSQDVQRLRSELESINVDLEQQTLLHDKNTAKIIKQDQEYDELNKDIAESKAKIESIDLKKQQTQVQKLKDGFKGIGGSIKDSIQSVGRLVLGLFAVRSAYMMVRQASSTLAQYDDTYAANLEYIRWMLAQAIAPALRYIVSLAATLLNYLLSILQVWFGLFKNVDLSAKAFNKMKAGAGGVAKAAKEIRKQLAGFDEMNVLQDQSSASGGGGGGGSAGPSIDFGKVVDEGKLAKIKDHLKEILAIIGAIVGVILLLKLGLGGLQALGIGIAIGGIIYAITSLIDYLKDPSWENFGHIITGIGIAIAGVAMAVGAWPVAIAGVAVAIIGIIVSNWRKIQSFFASKINWLEDKSDDVHKMFGDTIGNIYDISVDMMRRVLDFFDGQIVAAKKFLDGVIMFIKGIFQRDWDMVWHGLGKIVESVWDNLVAIFKNGWLFIWDLIKGAVEFMSLIITGLVDFIKELVKMQINQFKTDISIIKNLFSDLWSSFKNKASEAWQGVKNVFSNVGSFFVGIWNTIKGKFVEMGTGIGNAVGNAFRNVINAVLSRAQTVLNTPIRAINGLIGAINAIPGINLSRLSTFSLPRMATGGIVNMPNRGVNIGGAIAGESGREGILPLTDTRAMQVLGEEIGKWITINANIVNEMDGKVLSRQVRRIQTQEDFAFNS